MARKRIKDKDDVERGRAARKRRTDRELLYRRPEAERIKGGQKQRER